MADTNVDPAVERDAAAVVVGHGISGLRSRLLGSTSRQPRAPRASGGGHSRGRRSLMGRSTIGIVMGQALEPRAFTARATTRITTA